MEYGKVSPTIAVPQIENEAHQKVRKYPGPSLGECYHCCKLIRSKYRYMIQWEGKERIFHKGCAERLIDDLYDEQLKDRRGE